MIESLYELNEKINAIVNHIVKEACANTANGNYILDAQDACAVGGMGYDDFLAHRDFIISELQGREELLDVQQYDDNFDVTCSLDFCPKYEWQEGDEAVFGSKEDFESRIVKSVSQPISMARAAEILPLAVEHLLDSENSEYVETVFKLALQFTEKDALAFGLSERLGFNLPDSYFTVRDAFGDNVGARYYSSYEAALKEFKDYCAQGLDGTNGAMLGIVCKAEDKTHKCVLVQNVVNEYDENILKPQHDNINWDSLVVPEIELAALKAKQLVYPFDEITQGRIDELEKQLGIYERGVDTTWDLFVGKWRVHLVPTGERYGSNNNLVNEKEATLVEFYDMSVAGPNFPHGQFVNRYQASAFSGELNKAYTSMVNGLCLDGLNAHVWTVSGKDMTEVYKWLRNQPLKECDIVKPSLGEYISAAMEKNKDAAAVQDKCSNKDAPER